MAQIERKQGLAKTKTEDVYVEIWGHVGPLENHDYPNGPTITEESLKMAQDSSKIPTIWIKMARTSPKIAPREPPKSLRETSWGLLGTS